MGRFDHYVHSNRRKLRAGAWFCVVLLAYLSLIPGDLQAQLARTTDDLSTRNREVAELEGRLQTTRQELADAQGRLAEVRQQLAAPPASESTAGAGAAPSVVPAPPSTPQP